MRIKLATGRARSRKGGQFGKGGKPMLAGEAENNTRGT